MYEGYEEIRRVKMGKGEGNFCVEGYFGDFINGLLYIKTFH